MVETLQLLCPFCNEKPLSKRSDSTSCGRRKCVDTRRNRNDRMNRKLKVGRYAKKDTI